MWEFVESVQGVADACHAITLKDNPDDATPIIAGNVSFYNESSNGAIPPSPIVSCLGRLKDVTKAVPMHFQTFDSILIMAGKRRDELGGSVFYSLHDELGANVPQPNLEEVKNQIFALTDCINEDLVLSCHDIADGGVASTLAEMTFGNGIGCDITINSDLPTYKILFSETGGFVLEVSPENADAVISNFSKYGSDVFQIGTTGSNTIQINRVVDIVVSDAKETWANGLREKL
jgi:phosphoribosylformylglycinamidine synthase